LARKGHFLPGKKLIKEIKMFEIFKGLFEKKEDPLDKLLIEKGLDPEEVLDDYYEEREYFGTDSGIKRALNRVDEKKRKAQKIIPPGSLGTM
jgi:DNA polymerase III delta prime subunit